MKAYRHRLCITAYASTRVSPVQVQCIAQKRTRALAEGARALFVAASTEVVIRGERACLHTGCRHPCATACLV